MENRIAANEGWWATLLLIGLLATDAIALAAVGLVGYGMLGAWFGGGDNQSGFARAVLTGNSAGASICSPSGSSSGPT